MWTLLRRARWCTLLLPAVLFLASPAAAPIAAQCLVDNPGASTINTNRPRTLDVPAARFSPISAVNSSLPKWLCFTAGYRARFEGYTAGYFQPNDSDSYVLTRFRLGVAIKPAAWFKLYAESQDATAFWKDPLVGPPHQSTWDLRRAYGDLGDIEQGRIGFRVGRQDLGFGYGRLVGTSYWRNVSRGWDAALMVLNSSRLRVSAFAASPVIALANGLSHHQQGNNLHGIYGSLKNLIPGSVTEPYALWRLSPGIETEGGTLAKLDEKTVGLRWAGTVSGFDYDAEAAGQTGNAGPETIRAWAWSVIAGYTFESSRLRPRLFVQYDFASGDGNPKDGRRRTFDQLYPNVHDHHGLADQVAWRNLKSVRAGVRFSPRQDWMTAAAYSDWWLASATDGFYNSSGGVTARDPSGLSGTHIGREYDVQTSYRVNRDLELGAGIGYIRSGGFLVRTKHARSYTYPYVMLNYNFF